MSLSKRITNIYEALAGKMTANIVKVYAVFVLIISCIEFLAYKRGGFFSIVASRIWLGTGIICLTVFLIWVVNQVIEDIRNKSFFCMAGLMIILALFIGYIGNISYSDINADAAQQLAAGIDSFEARDWNYTGTAFLGYPNRQYILAAIPAVLFGRSIATLHWGFGYPFLIGLIALYLELRCWLREKQMNEAIALIPVYSFVCFRFITEYFMNFEQAITPVCLTMIGVALFLRLFRKPNFAAFFVSSWVVGLFCNSYTPILASLALFIVFLAIYAYQIYKTEAEDISKTINDIKSVKTVQHSERYYTFWMLILCVINLLAFLASTIVAKRSDRITEFSSDVSIFKFAWDSWKEFFMDSNASFLGLFAGIVVVYIALSLLGRFRIWDFIISGWVLGVVFFANYMVGYTTYEKAWILQRNMIIIPVLTVSIFLLIIHYCSALGKKLGMITQIGVLGLALLIGVLNFSQPHQSFDYFRYIQPVKYMIDYIEETMNEYDLSATDVFTIVWHTDNDLQSNIYDYAEFFFPNAITYSLSGEEYDEQSIEGDILIVIAEDDRLTSFNPHKHTEQKTYKNKRYDTEITVYRQVIER